MIERSPDKKMMSGDVFAPSTEDLYVGTTERLLGDGTYIPELVGKDRASEKAADAAITLGEASVTTTVEAADNVPRAERGRVVKEAWMAAHGLIARIVSKKHGYVPKHRLQTGAVREKDHINSTYTSVTEIQDLNHQEEPLFPIVPAEASVSAPKGLALYEAAKRREYTGVKKAGNIFAANAGENLSAASWQILDDYLDLRLAYVEKRGWIRGQSTDVDRYDSDPATEYFVKTRPAREGEESSRLVGGMRLTKVDSFAESLTWGMLGKRPDVQAAIAAEHEPTIRMFEEKAEQGDLWDLTRLVSQEDGSVGPRETISGLQELFGAAMTKTGYEKGRRPIWFFFTTEAFSKFLTASGITHHVLYAGEVTSGDEEKSLLCYVDALQRYDEIQQELEDGSAGRHHKSTRDALDRGIVSMVD